MPFLPFFCHSCHFLPFLPFFAHSCPHSRNCIMPFLPFFAIPAIFCHSCHFLPFLPLPVHTWIQCSYVLEHVGPASLREQRTSNLTLESRLAAWNVHTYSTCTLCKHSTHTAYIKCGRHRERDTRYCLGFFCKHHPLESHPSPRITSRPPKLRTSNLTLESRLAAWNVHTYGACTLCKHSTHTAYIKCGTHRERDTRYCLGFFWKHHPLKSHPSPRITSHPHKLRTSNLTLE